MKSKQSDGNKPQEKKKAEVIAKPTINEDDELYLSYLNKKMRYLTKKLKEISDLEKQEGELKMEQKQKISKKEQFIQENEQIEEVKTMYTNFLKESNCQGIKIQKEETAEQKQVEEQEKLRLQSEVEVMRANIQKQSEEKNGMAEEIMKLKGMVKEGNEVNARMEKLTVQKVVELMLVVGYHYECKQPVEKRVGAVIESLKACMKLNEEQTVGESLKESAQGLLRYVQSDDANFISQFLSTSATLDYKYKKQKQENAQQSQVAKQHDWNQLNNQEESQEEEQQEKEEVIVGKQQKEEEDEWNENEQQPIEERKECFQDIVKKEPKEQKGHKEEQQEDIWHVVGKEKDEKVKKKPRQFNQQNEQGEYKPKGKRGDFQPRGHRGGGDRPPYQQKGEQEHGEEQQQQREYQPRGQRGQRGGDYQPRRQQEAYVPRRGQQVYQEKFNDQNQ